MESMFDVVWWTRPTLPGSTQTAPNYKLCLPDVDELIAAILAAASLDPEVNLRFMKAEANEYVARDNNEATLTVKKS
jgi:hypothetical protein